MQRSSVTGKLAAAAALQKDPFRVEMAKSHVHCGAAK